MLALTICWWSLSLAIWSPLTSILATRDSSSWSRPSLILWSVVSCSCLLSSWCSLHVAQVFRLSYNCSLVTEDQDILTLLTHSSGWTHPEAEAVGQPGHLRSCLTCTSACPHWVTWDTGVGCGTSSWPAPSVHWLALNGWLWLTAPNDKDYTVLVSYTSFITE